jgi:hypothetical protein
MTIGKKFLERVLNEAKDVDGFKDNFDITTMPSTSPALANLPMPLARQVVQLYHLMGVSVETLEMRPKAVREAAMTVADELRTNRPLRLAAQRLFTALATAKGFARSEKAEVSEAADVMKNKVEVNLIGSRVVKQIEAVLAALKLPSGILSRSMKRDAQSLMDTAAMIQKGAIRSKFMMLASELGVDINTIGTEVEVTEATTVGTVGTVGTAPQTPQVSAYESAAQSLLSAMGVNAGRLPVSVQNKMKLVQRGDRGVAGENSRIVRLMKQLTDLLGKQGRDLQ